MTLYGSAPTRERLEQLIRRYYGGPSVLILHDDGRIETGLGVCSTRWEQKGRRFRFFSPD